MCWVQHQSDCGLVGREPTHRAGHDQGKPAQRAPVNALRAPRAIRPRLAWPLHHLVQVPSSRAQCIRGQPENDMSCIKLNDLSLNLALDRKAMAAIRGGGGAPWVYGWIQPYVPQTPSIGPVVNLYEVSNNFYANQMINQFQSVDVRNAGANSNITVSPDARNRNDMV
ncbi:conserved hypothetical protein [Burkholderia sp. H160]|nr:conserved hypothetical protein [Burkholderia sp. H160]